MQFALFLSLILPIALLSSPVQTDHVIFVFDNGEKNMVASMLKYAEKHDKAKLDNFDFRIVFMGASIDAMTQEPFSRYPDKLIHYKQLGIEETVDRNWKRNAHISEKSIDKLSHQLQVKKKAWFGVSCLIFAQMIQKYQENVQIEVLALRDNPFPIGDSDYFKVADAVQDVADKVAAASTLSTENLIPEKKIAVVGHGPIEEWQEEAQRLDKKAIIERLGFDPEIPIVVYAGTYGDDYEHSFKCFLEIIQDKNLQVIVVPHPRYKGIVEKRLCSNFESRVSKFLIMGEFEEEPSKKIKTVEALAVADAVVTADATSTVVAQGATLKKKILYVNPKVSEVSQHLCSKKILQIISNSQEFEMLIKDLRFAKAEIDVFQLLGIPKNGAELLWKEWTAPLFNRPPTQKK